MVADLQIDLRVVPSKSFGAALQYFTGSKDHNVVLRGMAKDRGLRINEYGVFRTGEIGPKKKSSKKAAAAEVAEAETEEPDYRDVDSPNYVAGRTEEEVYGASICRGFRPRFARRGRNLLGLRPESCPSSSK